MASTQIQPIYKMKKLLMISFFALITSLAHAGSCGDESGKEKKGEKTGVAGSSVVIACDKTDGGEGKKMEGKASSSSVPFELAGNCGGDDKTDKDKKEGKTTFLAKYVALV